MIVPLSARACSNRLADGWLRLAAFVAFHLQNVMWFRVGFAPHVLKPSMQQRNWQCQLHVFWILQDPGMSDVEPSTSSAT
jgi:hypothetical protein